VDETALVADGEDPAVGSASRGPAPGQRGERLAAQVGAGSPATRPGYSRGSMTAVKMVIRRLSFGGTVRPPGVITSQGWPNWW
jgi:hypothetical protein